MAITMRELQIDLTVLPAANADTITTLCFEAREILAAYMEQGIDLEEYQEAIDIEPVDLIATDNDDDDGQVVHETAPVPINSHQHVYLSNVPYTYDMQGRPVPLTEPGYVALRDTVISEDPAHGPRADAAQLIFRLPAPQMQPAAIYEGWSLEEAEQVTALHTRKLSMIGDLLQVVRVGLRHAVATDQMAYDELYHSTVPRPAVSASFEAMLRKWADEQ